MRWLAVARYRFLILLRGAKWVMPVLVIAIVGPVLPGGPLLESPLYFRHDAVQFFTYAGIAMLAVYWMHIMALSLLCWSFGIVPRRSESARPSDLMDAAPVSGQARYWGDVFGILGATLAIHLCATPLLALAVAQSAFPSSVFWYLELFIVAVLFFVSTMASWALRAEDSRWSQTRSARSAALVLLSLLLIVIATTRVEDFADAVAAFVQEPSTRSWSGLVGTIDSGALFIVLLLAVTGMFVTLYSIQSARSIERA